MDIKKFKLGIDGKEIQGITDEEIIEIGKNAIFPLQTQMSLSKRWGVSRQMVANWAHRHDDFPKEIEGIIAKTSKTPKVYAIADVEKYEKLRGLIK